MNVLPTKSATSHSTASNDEGSWREYYLWLLAAILLLSTLALVGCSSGHYASPKSTALGGAASYSQDVLREGDVISITCESVTNINSVTKIPLNGMLDLPFIGQVLASDKTTQQLQDELLELYSKQVRADVITVKLVQSASVIYVVGAVLKPGKIPMDRPMTVLEAVMEAGGYDPNRAKLSKVTVVRLEDGQQITYQINLAKVLDGKESTPFFLVPFDTVQVPNRTFNW